MTELMNLAQVLELFEREAVLFGTKDGFPESRAIELFGVKAVKYAKQDGMGLTFNAYCAGGHMAVYLTRSGVQTAATYCNVQLLKKRRITPAATEEG